MTTARNTNITREIVRIKVPEELRRKISDTVHEGTVKARKIREIEKQLYPTKIIWEEGE